MEVFMRNLPIDLNEDGLKTQLEPFMSRLDIVDFICEKPKRKSIGNVTFLSRRDGERFLQIHGQRSAETPFQPFAPAPAKSNLKLTGADVFCTLSKRQPQEFTIKTLSHAMQERANPQYTVEEDSSAVLFFLSGFSCGYYTFVSEQLGYVPEIEWGNRGTVKFTKRNVVVNLDNDQLIRIPLNSIVELVWFSDGLLTLTLSTVPLFFEATNGIDFVLSVMSSLALDQGNMRSNRSRESTRTRIRSLGKGHAEVVGQCLVYQFNVSTSALGHKIEELKQREIVVTQYDVTIPRALLPNTAGFTHQMGSLKVELAKYTMDRSVPFELLFHIQALAYNAYLLPSTALELARQLRREITVRRSKGLSPVSADATKKLFDTIDWPSPYGDPAEFEASYLLQAVKQNEEEVKKGLFHGDRVFIPSQNVARICRVTVTPSRITLHGPEMEPNNRILRKFPNHHEYFIRVQFCDENGQDLHFSPQVNNAKVFARYKDVLKRGIEIAGRTYTFLGFSHSSLRAYSVWFSAPFFDDNGDLQTYFTIIEALGNFSNITSPARCAARIGQAFSETPFDVDIKKSKMEIFHIPDVKSPDGARVFSDGVGAVSQNVIEAIWDSLPLSKGFPTCFQIRLGGAKGMLALDSRLDGSVIALRPSMVKFASEDLQTLEICDVGSQPIPLVLNRQIIKIMEDMGVSENWFFKLQNIQVSLLRGITASIQSTSKYLKAQNISRSLRLHKLFRKFGTLGIDYRNDQFLRSVVEALVLRELRLLKHRARIPVQKGVTLFGIMDETGFLQENEVFVTYETTKAQFTPPPGPGPLLVTRSPALFDGDIQIAHNIVPPQDHPLAQHRNCIVFSQRGSRDLPSQLSGGDLDGDIFNIIWDPEGAPAVTYPPADYPRVQPVDIGRVVTKDDMADFFINFMETDRLGVIATRHLIMADQLTEGSCDQECKRLAQLHSMAVDFSKTGIPVKMEDLPRMTSRYRPDFMAPGPQVHIHDKSDIHLDTHILQAYQNEDEGLGPAQKYYKSVKILGKLYRAIDERQIWSENVRLRSKIPFWGEFMEAMIQKCSVFGPMPWIYRIDEARLIRKAYENAILSAMNDFSEHPIHPISELEVFIGHILNKTGVQTHRQRARSIKLSDEFDRIVTWVMSQMRPYGNHPIPLTGYETEHDALALCLACVYIAGENDESAKIRRRKDWYGGLQSFRVVSACALLAELELFEENQK